MSSQYNGGQWNQNQMNFAPLHLEEEYPFNPMPVSGNDPHQHLLDGQTSYGSEAYQYSQQQLPSNSTLHNAYTPSVNNQQHHPLTVPSQHPQANPGYAHNVYAQQQRVLPVAEGGIPYRSNPATFNLPRPSICLHPYRESKPLESTKQPSRRPRLLKHFPTKAFPGLPLLPICSRKIIMKGLQKRHLRVKDLVSSLTSRMIKKVISPKNKKTPTSPNCGPYIFTIDWHY